jgi:hypothetical protein
LDKARDLHRVSMTRAEANQCDGSSAYLQDQRSKPQSFREFGSEPRKACPIPFLMVTGCYSEKRVSPSVKIGKNRHIERCGMQSVGIQSAAS